MTTTATAEEGSVTSTPVVEESGTDSGVATSPEARTEVPTDADAPAATAPHDGTEPAAPVTDAPQAEAAEPAPTASAPEPASGGQSDAELFEAALASLESDDPKRETSSGISRGDRVEAKVIQVEKDKVFVDLGTKAEAVLPLSELTDARSETAIGLVQPGDTFEVIVLKTASAEGAAIVSKRKADFDQTWQRVLDAFDEGKVFEAQVLDRVKGGLVVDIGVRGFVPATHVGNGKLRNIEKYVGQTLNVKIIEVDRERKKVVLSNKAAEGERKEEVKKEIFENVKTGDVLPGVVRRLTDYGAFVDLGGIDGLLHISEMSWYRIDHPREVLKEGDEINVQVLRLDSNSGRVSLGLRQVLPDPWNIIKQTYQQGQKIKCTVGRIVQSGAFVRLPEGAEAFLPLSECSNKRVKKANEVLEEGQEIEPTIIDLRPDDRRMVLSLRDGAQPGADYSYDRGGKRRPGGMGGKRPMRQDTAFDAPAATMRAPSGGATIGERLGMLKGMLRPEPEEPVADASASEDKSGE
ncbi:MAG: S1 RNA-binding domain-containing protein [Armatimonadetes bacterium]|nr:S1 RNA-binding domain-containing protein [Armatimonadota bacterium]